MSKIGRKIFVTKMEGCGNSYGIIEDLDRRLSKKIDYSILVKTVSHPIYGLNTDGILVLNRGKRTRYRMRIFNPDGSEAEMCGNGIRLMSRYLYEQGFVKKKKFLIETHQGEIIVTPELKIKKGKVSSVEVKIGEGKILGRKTLKFKGKKISGTKISVGNPHFVIFTNESSEKLCRHYGPLIENHREFFPQRTNVEFAKIVSENEIKLWVWERGAGFTLACGTGACATAFSAYKQGKIENQIKVYLPGGILVIRIKNNEIFLEGPAEYCCQAELFLR